jgi:hypothetical protein
VATPGHPEPLLLGNHVHIIALTPDLQRVSFYSIIGFLDHSSHHRAYTIPNTYKGVIRALRPLLCFASLAARNPTTGMPVLITKLEQMTLRELIAIAKLAHTGFSLGCPCIG